MRRGAIGAWFKARRRNNGGPIVRLSNAEPGVKRSRPFGLLPARASAALLGLPIFAISAAPRALRTPLLAVQRMRESKSDRLLEQRIAIETPALQARAQLVERLRLDLPHTLSCHADLARELFEGRHLAIVESVSPFDHD